jgi:outer membrane biosynthesis protein TonB
MAETVQRLDSLRLSRFEAERLSLALALSIAAHLFGWGSYELLKGLNLLPQIHNLAHKLEMMPKPAVTREEPLQFVTVDQASTEPPKDTKYYSSKNSRAANPDVDHESNVPKIDGKQTDVPKTETVPRPEFNKLQPAPKTAPQEAAQPAQPAPSVQPGDIAMAKPQNDQQQQPQPQEMQPPRPRTIQQALAQSNPRRTPGVAMRQEGGVSRRLETSLFDVKSTPFGEYDAEFVDAVTYRWYSLLDSQQFALDRTGRVRVRFHLNHDGSITDITVVENTVGEVLGYVCQKAISDPSPYKPWTPEMRRLVGANYREITFTFYYY